MKTLPPRAGSEKAPSLHVPVTQANLPCCLSSGGYLGAAPLPCQERLSPASCTALPLSWPNTSISMVPHHQCLPASGASPLQAALPAPPWLLDSIKTLGWLPLAVGTATTH